MARTYLGQFAQIAARHTLDQARAMQNLVELRLLFHEHAVAHDRPAPPLDRQALEHRIRRFGSANAKIAARGTEVEDYVLDLPAQQGRLALFGGESPGLDRRMALYRARVDEVLDAFYPPAATLPAHLIHVTCTGYVAPSAAQRIAARAGRTTVTHAYHMGCYAALPAIRTGRGFIATKPTDEVDVVHTEICSLHFDPTTIDAEQIVMQSLFADGHIKYKVSRDPPAVGLEILALDEQVLPASHDLMTWTVGARQFDMTLSREVPLRIAPHLRGFVAGLLAQAGAPDGAASIYAIHPGGPKIIEGVSQALGLAEAQTAESREILRRRGNMSSATLPHIWQEIVENPERQRGEVVVSLAFGPGITLSGGVFRICRT